MHSVIDKIAFGVSKKKHIRSIIDCLKKDVPIGIWSDAKNEGLILKEISIPIKHNCV
jgi:hypothetical protein